jgi:hypothetical protein
METIREIELFGGPFDGLKRQLVPAAEEPSAIGIVFHIAGEEKRVWYARREDGRYMYLQHDHKRASAL